jgi:hypothetical protein
MVYAPVDYARYSATIVDSSQLEVGDRIKFTRGQRGTQLLVAGFSHPEAWATWTDGREARLRVCMKGGVGEPTRLRFLLAPLVNERRPALNAAVHVEGQPAEHWTFSKDQQYVERSVVLAPGVACRGIAISFDDVRPVSELGVAGDGRSLGLAFLALSVEAVSR